MGGDGWTDSRLKLIGIQLLDLVHQKSKDGEVPPLYPYGKELDDFEFVLAAAHALVAAGLIKSNASASGSLSPYLTPAGKTLVLERRERQSDPKRRAIACRDALLDWCYADNAEHIDEFAGDVRAHFEGDPFTRTEIRAAASIRRPHRALRGRGRPWLTRSTAFARCRPLPA
jgi:hypothetical protein